MGDTAKKSTKWTVSPAEQSQNIAFVIATTKIKKVEEKKELDLGVQTDLIKNLIGLGVKIENGLIRDLVIIKESGGDVNQHLEDLYISGGQGSTILTPTKKVQGFPKLVATFKSTVDYIKEHTDLVERIDRAKIDELEQSIADLKSLINNPNNN